MQLSIPKPSLSKDRREVGDVACVEFSAGSEVQKYPDFIEEPSHYITSTAFSARQLLLLAALVFHEGLHI